MEFNDFFKILKRHKLTIIIIPVITVIITYFLVRNQVNTYTSQAKIATGIVDQTQIVIAGIDLQESKVNQEFSNLIEMLRSKKILDMVAYKLIIHDLTSDKPYRKPSTLLSELNGDAKKHALAIYNNLYSKREPLSLADADQNGLNKLLISMHYDNQSILKSLLIYRVQSSDYINVQFDAETPELSAAMVNTLCTEFINYYTILVKDGQQRTINFLATLLRSKQDTLNAKILALKNYKIKNHVLNLNEKAKSLYGQLSDFETRREEAEKNTYATQAAINSIDKKFDPSMRQYSESNKVDETQQVLATQAQLQAVNDAYVQSNFDPKYSAKIDSLRNVISNHLGQLSDKYILNPSAAKKDLVDQKLALQVQNDLAKNSTGAINKELSRLNTNFNNLVPHEAATQSLESAVNIASQEYLEILEKYNQASTQSGFSGKVRLVEIADLGLLQPSKKMLLVIISGVVSFAVCIIVLFILFFFDNTIKTPRELADSTKIPVLGYLNLLKGKTIDLRDIWNSTSSGEMKQFRNLIQALRFEVDNELGSHKILLINSMEKAEGKTFLAINLAYAYASINKKVLLIDGNFGNPDITKSTQTKTYLEDVLNGVVNLSALTTNQKVTCLGNKGNDTSLLEISSATLITEKLTELKAVFDIIIIEAPALALLNRSKEWILFSDKILTVFEAGQTINANAKQHIEYLKSLKDKFTGWILNTVSSDELADSE